LYMFKKWDKQRDDGITHYDMQTKLLKEALSSDEHHLDQLLRLMRQNSESVIYLCGTRLDNEFGFGSNDLGLAISVLPQDAYKAAEPGYHPGSTEVYVIFQGSLIIEYLDRETIKSESLGQFRIRVIPPSQCHRVRNERERKAASLIVKTNPHHKPGVIRCPHCTYYKNPEDCLLHRSWIQEQEVIGTGSEG